MLKRIVQTIPKSRFVPTFGALRVRQTITFSKYNYLNNTPRLFSPSTSQIRNYAKKKKKRGDDDDEIPADVSLGISLKDLQTKMEKYIAAYKKQLQNMKIGRAHPSTLEGLMVKTPEGNFSLKSLGTVVVKNPRLLTVTVYDKDVIGAVEQAIKDTDMGFNPVKKGTNALDVPIPKLTKEIREAAVKEVKKYGEQTKENIRGVRKEGHQELKKIKKYISEDDAFEQEKDLQQLTDKFVKQVDELTKQKEQELMNL